MTLVVWSGLGGRGGTPGNSWGGGGVCRPVLKIPTLFRNNLLLIRLFCFLSCIFGIQTIHAFIHSRSSGSFLGNHTRFQTKMDKVCTCFQTKTAQKTPPFGAAHTYMAYLREYPSPPGVRVLKGESWSRTPTSFVVAIPKNVFFPSLTSVPKFWRIPLRPVADKSRIPLTFLESRDVFRSNPAFTWIASDRVFKGIGTLISIIDHDALGLWLWLLTPSPLKKSV